MPRILIIGGGISGLTLAYRLEQRFPAAELLVLERESRLGGTIATIEDLARQARKDLDRPQVGVLEIVVPRVERARFDQQANRFGAVAGVELDHAVFKKAMGLLVGFRFVERSV